MASVEHRHKHEIEAVGAHEPGEPVIGSCYSFIWRQIEITVSLSHDHYVRQLYVVVVFTI